MKHEEVKAYIDNHVLHAEAFDSATEAVQRKAVNNAEEVLKSIYKRFNENNPLPIEAIAYQAIYMLSKDDSALRADNGAFFVGFNGVSMTYAQSYRTVSPDVVRILGRRTGRYANYYSDTNRGIMDDSNE